MAVLTACDPYCTEECVVKNLSGHNVTVMRYYTLHSGYYNNFQPIEDSVRIYTDIIMNGAESPYVDGRLGCTGRMYIQYTMKELYWQDSVRFEFADGTTRVFLPDCDTVWGPYAFNSDSYTYEEKRNQGIPRNQTLWARMTYTLTTEDYERCKGE